MKKVILYDLKTGHWETTLMHSSVVLSAGELEVDVVLCDITSWSDERIEEFAAQDMEAQIFDLEQLEFEEWRRRYAFDIPPLKSTAVLS